MVLDIAKKEKVKKIYGLLNRIIWQLEESEHYNYIPGTKEDGWDFLIWNFLQWRGLRNVNSLENQVF